MPMNSWRTLMVVACLTAHGQALLMAPIPKLAVRPYMGSHLRQNVRCAKGPIAMASSASSHGMNVVVELIKGFINPRSVYAAFQKSWTARHQLTKVKVSGLAFPEGPRWHDGKLWFSDMHSLSVLTMEADGTLETVCRVENCPSGLGWLPDGRLLVVSMKDKRVLRREHSGELVEHASLSRASPRSRPTTWWSTRKAARTSATLASTSSRQEGIFSSRRPRSFVWTRMGRWRPQRSRSRFRTAPSLLPTARRSSLARGMAVASPRSRWVRTAS